MEVLSGGFTTKYWIPIEDEPDIDRFIDEDIAVDLNGFTLRGILRKVSTCKKKNKETKEFDYYKEITIDVVGLDADAGQTISIPDKKDEYECAVELRYIPDAEPLEKDSGTDDGPAPEEELDFEAENNLDGNDGNEAIDPAKDPQDEAYEGDDDEHAAEPDNNPDRPVIVEPDKEPDKPVIVKPDNPDSPDIEADDFFDDPKPDAVDGTADDEFFDEPTSVDNGSGEEIKDKNPPDSDTSGGSDDDDDINWD
jgi:hypothetical protein